MGNGYTLNVGSINSQQSFTIKAQGTFSDRKS